jgi:hypothetical protein
VESGIGCGRSRDSGVVGRRADHSDVNCLLKLISLQERIFYGARACGRVCSGAPPKLSPAPQTTGPESCDAFPGLDPAYVAIEQRRTLFPPYVLFLLRHPCPDGFFFNAFSPLILTYLPCKEWRRGVLPLTSFLLLFFPIHLFRLILPIPDFNIRECLGNVISASILSIASCHSRNIRSDAILDYKY